MGRRFRLLLRLLPSRNRFWGFIGRERGGGGRGNFGVEVITNCESWEVKKSWVVFYLGFIVRGKESRRFGFVGAPFLKSLFDQRLLSL